MLFAVVVFNFVYENKEKNTLKTGTALFRQPENAFYSVDILKTNAGFSNHEAHTI